jgi:hypothetical protein
MSVAKSIGTSFAGEGVQNKRVESSEEYAMRYVFAPPPRQRRYSPYKQGESAIRIKYPAW